MNKYQQKFVFYKVNGESHLIEGRNIFNALQHAGLTNEAGDYYTTFSATGDMPQYVYDEAGHRWVSNNDKEYALMIETYGVRPYTTSVLKEEELLNEELENISLIEE